MASSNFYQLRSSCTVKGIRQDADWTYCTYRHSNGDAHKLKSRFFVGADGKTGYTRKNYLETLGIRMEQAHE
jgi:2-polyprenyl-6-methoxyphenol hydroxylase-like FAD-dependent oxidoreductase